MSPLAITLLLGAPFVALGIYLVRHLRRQETHHQVDGELLDLTPALERKRQIDLEARRRRQGLH